MSLLAKAVGFLSGNGDAVAKPVDAIGNAFDKIFTSDDERMAGQAVLEKLRQHPMELQAAINMVDAQSRNWWQAGWRPFLGWICGLSMAIYYIPKFSIAAGMWCWLSLSTGEIVPYPSADIDGLINIVLTLGAARTFEKFGKVAK